jgi:GNAT superfamily N-acetyltransferase
MEILNCTMADLDPIFDLYRSAVRYQKERFTSHWPEFDRDMVVEEIREGRQWKLQDDDRIQCVWATAYSDPLIWKERDAQPSVYIHRIAVDPASRGKALVRRIVEWAKPHAAAMGREFVRMDTVGENHKLIEHYTGCGFEFLGLSHLTDTEGLPAHYHNAVVSLFQLKV